MCLSKQNSTRKANRIQESSSLENKEEGLNDNYVENKTEEQAEIQNNDGNKIATSRKHTKSNNLRNKKIKTIIIFISIFVGLAIITTAIVAFANLNNTDSIFYDFLKRKTPLSPNNLLIDEFDENTSFSFLVKWDHVANASSYTLEYEYELYPGEIKEYETVNNGAIIERKRGEFHYRVKANNKNGDSEFTEWTTFYIKPLRLEIPEINFVQEQNFITINWTEVNYKYYNNYYKVSTYEFIDATYWYGDDAEYHENWPLYTPKENKKITITKGDNNYIGDVLVVKIRALNCMYLLISDDGIIKQEKINAPERLYDIYEVSDEWAEVEIIIEK